MSKLCPVCQIHPVGRNKVCCSQACYSLYKSNTKNCVVCGNKFQAPPSAATITCSAACSAENRRGKSDELLAALDKAHAVASSHPLTGRFETHINAKSWVIQSPDGTVYRCRNLMLWLRDHEDLLEGTIRQAWGGFSHIKATALGKRKKKVYQWKGWRLLDWGD